MGIFHAWHTKLNMRKNSLDWHKQDIQSEYEELLQAKGFVHRWSELADVVYTYTRARWSGHRELTFPFGKLKLFWGSLYMFPKYTSRWKLFRKAGNRVKPGSNISAVRNPKKIDKLHEIARENNLDHERFKEEVKKLLSKSILLK
ncbi:MAG TPA: hypothetical protein P5328_02075 [Candidatus Paceibacterota bacterium]|nr:hypothetical protein [Candidatus Paceibacterota bacterium]HRZ34461.1 hypothetical protein [Candidatus Paceibacterota bacterium]